MTRKDNMGQVEDCILKSCRKFKDAKDIFKMKLWEMVCSEPNNKGVILQKKSFLVRENAFVFTVTIERGDKLNGAKGL